jgi:hypothetical protein
MDNKTWEEQHKHYNYSYKTDIIIFLYNKIN